jgi:hypothetical protein
MSGADEARSAARGVDLQMLRGYRCLRGRRGGPDPADSAELSGVKTIPEPALSGDPDQSPSAGAPVALRLRVFLTRAKLDREIGSECPYESTPALALRARQLTHPSTRRQIARELREAVAYVDRAGQRPIDTAVVIEPAAVRGGRQSIFALAQLLEGSAAVQPAGIIRARRFLTDGLGPMYDSHSEQSLTDAVQGMVTALEGDSPAGHDVHGHFN